MITSTTRSRPAPISPCGNCADRDAPPGVEDDFRAYLRCGILAHGFARIRSDACAAERLVAFSCKGRGVCPSRNARRMVEVAAQLTDHVLTAAAPPAGALPAEADPPLPAPSESALSCPTTRVWPATCCASCSAASAPPCATPARRLRVTPSSAPSPSPRRPRTERPPARAGHPPRPRRRRSDRRHGQLLRRRASRCRHCQRRRHHRPAGLPAARRRPLPLGSPPRPHLRGLAPRLPRLRRRQRILAVITAAEPVHAILTHLALPTTAPPLPARGPPQHDLAFDADPGFDVYQTPACDPTEPEPVPNFDFDQSAGA
jgi:hypothetical protein